MNKKIILAAGVLTTTLMLNGCGITTNGSSNNTGGNILGEVLGSMGNANTIGNVLNSVLGIDKPSERDLIGTWHYSGFHKRQHIGKSRWRGGCCPGKNEVDRKLQGHWSSAR